MKNAIVIQLQEAVYKMCDELTEENIREKIYWYEKMKSQSSIVLTDGDGIISLTIRLRNRREEDESYKYRKIKKFLFFKYLKDREPENDHIFGKRKYFVCIWEIRGYINDFLYWQPDTNLYYSDYDVNGIKEVYKKFMMDSIDLFKKRLENETVHIYDARTIG